MKLPARKRANIESCTNTTTNGTNKKTKPSILASIPLDIIFEICGYLSPRDMLSISRVAKTLRETLMTRGAKTVWRAARTRFDAPECPSWVSEPAWAALLFGHLCQCCGTSNVHQVDFLLLKRVCIRCKKTHLLIRDEAAKHYSPSVLGLLPSTNDSPWLGNDNDNYYWDPDLERMVEHLSKLKADVKQGLPNSQKTLLSFKQEHKQRVAQIWTLIRRREEWLYRFRVECQMAKREAQDKRLEQIKEKFRELGFVDESDLSTLDARKECCSTAPLTTTGWNRICPKLERCVLKHRGDRLRKEARNNRRSIVQSRYNSYRCTLHPSQWKYLPTNKEIFSYESFAMHLDAPVEVEITAHTFDDVFRLLPELLASAMEDRKDCLRSLLPDEDTVSVAGSCDPMDLATAVFQCTNDHRYLFGWDDIASHHCPDREFKTRPQLEFSPFAASVVKKVVKSVGLDCATITVADLDKVDERFSCDSCASYEKGGKYFDVGYDWRKLANHLRIDDHHHNPNMNFTILVKEESEEVRQQECRAKWEATKWTCAHCTRWCPKNLQTRQVVLKHLNERHAIVNASEPTDFLFFERFVELRNPFLCLLCQGDGSDASYILPNIENHLKKIDRVVDGEEGQDFAANQDVVDQPSRSVLRVRPDLC